VYVKPRVTLVLPNRLIDPPLNTIKLSQFLMSI